MIYVNSVTFIPPDLGATSAGTDALLSYAVLLRSRWRMGAGGAAAADPELTVFALAGVADHGSSKICDAVFLELTPSGVAATFSAL